MSIDKPKIGEYRIGELPKGFFIMRYQTATSYEPLSKTRSTFNDWFELDENGNDSGDTFLYKSFQDAVYAVKNNFGYVKPKFYKIPD